VHSGGAHRGYVAGVATPQVLLGLLSRGPRHGYELKREHDQRFGQARPLPYGQVYATLGRLLRDGLVEESGPQPGAGPDRRVYALTAAGRTALDTWLAGVEEPGPYVASPLLERVVVALLSGASAAGYLAAQRRAHQERRRALILVTTAPGASLSDVLAAEHALLQLDADLRWVETAARRLRGLTAEVQA